MKKEVMSSIVVKDVLEIKPGEYLSKIELEEVIVEDKLEKIFYEAFTGCINLKKLVLPNTIKKIDLDAFNECDNLVLTMEKPIDNFPYKFKKIKDTIYTKETMISENGLVLSTDHKILYEVEDKDLEKIVVPDSVEKIWFGAFMGHSKVTEIICSDNVKKVGAHAFSRCENLKKVRLSENIQILENNLFEYSTSLEDVNLSDNIKKIKECCFTGCRSIKKIILPSKITEIENETFFGCELLEEVVFNKKLQIIKEYSFCYCKSLKEIKLSDNVLCIGENAFLNNESLETVVLSKKIDHLSSFIFDFCPKLKEINMYNFEFTHKFRFFVGYLNILDKKTNEIKYKIFIPNSLWDIQFVRYNVIAAFNLAKYDRYIKLLNKDLYKECASFRLQYPFELSKEDKEIFSNL